MTRTTPLPTRQPRIVLTGLILAIATLLSVGSALAVDPGLASHPGYVDGSFLAEYADEDGEFVEVTLDEALLKLFSGPVSAYDADVGNLTENLKSVRALVITLRDGTRDEVFDRIKQIRGNLEGRGWQQIAEVREKDDRVHVMLKTSDDRIQGVTVLVLDDKELVFTNIAGDMLMKDLEQLASKHQFPGLDQLSQGNPEDAR